MRTLLTIVLIISFSCKKGNPDLLKNHHGDYQLSFIKVSDIEYWVPEELDYETGLRVLENNQINTYVDGEIFKKYTFKETLNKTKNSMKLLYEKSMQEEVVITLYEDGKIELTDFPFPNKLNVFH